jgi:hypothetical protein
MWLQQGSSHICLECSCLPIFPIHFVLTVPDEQKKVCFENGVTELKLNNFLHHAGTKARLFLILTWSCVLLEGF